MRLYGTLNVDTGRLVVNDLDKALADNIQQLGIETTMQAEVFLASVHGIHVSGWKLDDRYGNGVLVAQGLECRAETRPAHREPNDSWRTV